MGFSCRIVEGLRARENEMRAGVSDRRQTAPKDKRLALFERLIVDAGHQDLSIVDDLTRGFGLTGELPKSAATSAWPRFLAKTSDPQPS